MTTAKDLSPILHPVIVDTEFEPAEWESFWQTAMNGTVFNSLTFLSYHAADRFNSHHVVFRRKGNLVGLFPAAVVDDEDAGRCWISHPGASYGGPVWSISLKYHHILSMVESLVKHARKQRFSQIRMTLPPIIYNNYHDQSLDFALLANGFKVIRSELSQAARLDFDEAELLSSFVNKTRTAFRKAEREGLTFRMIDSPTQIELDRFWKILVENRAGLGIVPAHSREEIERLHDLLPEKLMLAVIEHQGKIIACIWNFICNSYTVLEFYMAHLDRYQHLRPVPYLIYKTMLWARKQGFRYIDFGISSIRSAPTWGLLRFKENFRARHYFRLTYQKNL